MTKAIFRYMFLLIIVNFSSGTRLEQTFEDTRSSITRRHRVSELGNPSVVPVSWPSKVDSNLPSLPNSWTVSSKPSLERTSNSNWPSPSLASVPWPGDSSSPKPSASPSSVEEDDLEETYFYLGTYSSGSSTSSRDADNNNDQNTIDEPSATPTSANWNDDPFTEYEDDIIDGYNEDTDPTTIVIGSSDQQDDGNVTVDDQVGNIPDNSTASSTDLISTGMDDIATQQDDDIEHQYEEVEPTAVPISLPISTTDGQVGSEKEGDSAGDDGDDAELGEGVSAGDDRNDTGLGGGDSNGDDGNTTGPGGGSDGDNGDGTELGGGVSAGDDGNDTGLGGGGSDIDDRNSTGPGEGSDGDDGEDGKETTVDVDQPTSAPTGSPTLTSDTGPSLPSSVVYGYVAVVVLFVAVSAGYGAVSTGAGSSYMNNKSPVGSVATKDINATTLSTQSGEYNTDSTGTNTSDVIEEIDSNTTLHSDAFNTTADISLEDESYQV